MNKKILMSMIIGLLLSAPMLCGACECEKCDFGKIGNENILSVNIYCDLFGQTESMINNNENNIIYLSHTCQMCNGRGYNTCGNCYGKGYIVKSKQNIKERCSWCNGRGKKECSNCFGRGKVSF